MCVFFFFVCHSLKANISDVEVVFSAFFVVPLIVHVLFKAQAQGNKTPISGRSLEVVFLFEVISQPGYDAK